jgi:hypothetical protein
MTESFPARSGNGQTYAFPPYVSGELSGRVTTLAAISGESAIFGPRIGPGVPVVHAMLAQAVVLRQTPERGCGAGLQLNEHFHEARDVIYRHACRLGCEGLVSKRLGSPYVSGRTRHWLKFKNPAAPTVKREAEEDWK